MKKKLSDMALHLGKSKQTLSRQLKRHGVAPDAKGLYDEKKVLTAIKAGVAMDKNRLQEQLKSCDADPGSLIEKRLIEQVRKLTAEADTVEFKLAEMRGDYVTRAKWKADVGRIAEAFRAAVNIWIQSTAAEVGDAVTKGRLEHGRALAFHHIQGAFDAGKEDNPDT